MHQQQAALYQQHVREVRRLQAALQVAEGKASRRHAEDVVKCHLWATMADALGSAGDEQQRNVAMMGRCHTLLRLVGRLSRFHDYT